MATTSEDSLDLGQAECRHHWVIESPNGPMSLGVCKLCGTEREFRNSLP